MRFTFEGVQFESELDDETRSRSTHTGNDLTSGTIQVRAQDKDPLFKRLQDGGILLREDGTKWRVLRTRSSYRIGSDTVSNYTLEIEEFENREPSSVDLDGLSLKPERYREESDGRTLTIKMRLAVPTSEAPRLREALSQDKVRIVRHDVDENPRSMDADVLAWSAANDETVFDVQFQDIARRGRREPLPGPFAELYRIRETAVSALASATVLLDVLAAKGILSAAEVEGLKEQARRQGQQRIIDFRKTQDARALPFARAEETDEE